MEDMSGRLPSKLGDHAVYIEDAQRLDDGARQGFSGSRRAGEGVQRGHDIGDGSPAVAQLDEPVNQATDLDPLGSMWGAQNIAPGERPLGQHGLPLDERAGRQHRYEIAAP